MFTGLIESVGQVTESRPTSGGFRLRISTPLAGELALGESVAVNGVCLTVVATEPGTMARRCGAGNSEGHDTAGSSSRMRR